MAGYPVGTVPRTSVEYDSINERPEGLQMVGKAHSEEKMLDFMVRYERIFPDRLLPKPLVEDTI